MLRSELIRAANNLRDVIARTQLPQAIMSYSSSSASESTSGKTILDVYNLWILATSRFSNAEKQILKIFRLDNLTTADFWSSVLSLKTARPSAGTGLRRTLENLSFLERQLPQIVQLLLRESDIISTQETIDVPRPSDRLSIFLKEENNKVSSAKRVLDAIESIYIIYSVLAEMNNLSGNDLAVTGCDSGSDKSFDFTGVPQIIKESK